MSELQIIEGAVMPLFDRLRLAKSAAEAQPLRALNRRELQESVCRELAHLLNTRSPTLADAYSTKALTVVDYGIPDFSALSPQNSHDRARMGTLITRAIAAFEPRLQQVTATVALLPEQHQVLCVTLQALLHIETFTEPITLAAVLPHKNSGGPAVRVQPLMPLIKD